MALSTKQITRLYTLGSKYDNQSIGVVLDGKGYRIRCADLLELLGDHKLKAEQARVHKYLRKE